MINKCASCHSGEEWHQIMLGNRASGLNDYKYCRDNSLAQTVKLNNLGVFKCQQAVLLYMPNYVHEPEGVEALMSCQIR